MARLFIFTTGTSLLTNCEKAFPDGEARKKAAKNRLPHTKNVLDTDPWKWRNNERDSLFINDELEQERKFDMSFWF